MRRQRYCPATAVARVSVNEIAEELGVSPTRARKLLDKHGWWLGDGRRLTRRSGVVTYSADVIDKLRALLGQGHRQIDEPEHDWLSRYLGGT